MGEMEAVHAEKACAYVTRNGTELLVFEGPEHDGLQVPKGTIESDETPREAVVREIREESGLTDPRSIRHLTTDVWTRRRTPPKRYRRHFFHVAVDENRESWTHVVTGTGAEQGLEFEYIWIEVPTDGRSPWHWTPISIRCPVLPPNVTAEEVVSGSGLADPTETGSALEQPDPKRDDEDGPVHGQRVLRGHPQPALPHRPRAERPEQKRRRARRKHGGVGVGSDV